MKFSRKSLFIPLAIMFSYLVFNYIFNFNIWHYSIYKVPDTLVVFGEWPVYEYVAEIVRENILNFRNPFTEAPLLFPFGWNFVLEDVAPINGFYFLLLRPFLSVHDSFTIVILFGIVASCLFMYLLLRQLKIKRSISYILSLAYGYSPFVVARLGHPTYTALYLFPLLGIFFIRLLKSENKRSITINSIGLAICCALVILTNLYFAVMVALMVLFFLFFFLLRPKNSLIIFAKSKLKYVLVVFGSVLLLLYPWFIKVYRSLLLSQNHRFNISSDSLQFSADLFGILTPATTGLVFGNFVEYLSAIFTINPKFENLVYPGILILIGLTYLIFYRNSISPGVREKIKPLLFVAFCFWVLTLGPRLHILGYETILTLPFKVLNYIPFVQLARSPARFIVPFIFLSTIIVALVADDFARKKLKDSLAYWLFCIAAMMIFLVDQSYTASFSQVLNPIPQKIYERLEKASPGPVIEIPFAIRDGLQYVGDFNAVWALRTQLIYNNPKFSVYAGRLNPSAFDYYRDDAFIGYMASVIDENNQRKIVVNQKKMIDSIEFFGLANIVLKEQELYTETIDSLLSNLDYSRDLSHNGYRLYTKKIQNKEFLPINLADPNGRFYFGYGWSEIEPNGRWIEGKVATVFFRMNDKFPLKLEFEASTLSDNQRATINVNSKEAYEIDLSKAKKNYKIILKSNLRTGVNRITFIFEKTTQPSNLLPNNNDKRNLSVFFTKLKMSKQQSL